MDMLAFGANDIENALSRLSDKDIDKLAFGAVQLDKNGIVLMFNSAEGEIVGRSAKDVVGKNFFREVAPCTNSPEFFGRFINGVRTGSLNATFDYTFDYRMKPTQVRVQMAKAPVGDTYWVLIKRMS